MGPDRCEVKYWLTSGLSRPCFTLVSLRGNISPSLISERERDCRKYFAIYCRGPRSMHRLSREMSIQSALELRPVERNYVNVSSRF